MSFFSNPHADDPAKAEVFELGYLTGFQDPEGKDLFRPFSPELLDVFTEGAEAGRQDAFRPPPSDPRSPSEKHKRLS